MDERSVLDTFLELCRIDSPSRRERRLQERISARLREMGLKAYEDDAAVSIGGECGNLLVDIPPTVSDAPAILLAAHLDTIESNEGVGIRVEDGIVRTEGSAILGADDKAGVAPLLEALRYVLENDVARGPVRVAFTVCEEVGLLGSKALPPEALDVDMAFVLDAGPPVGSFITRAPSLTELHAEVRGKAAHAGVRPEEGVSAIRLAAEAIVAMRLGRLDADTTANVGIIRGGEATNVVCDRVELRAEARSLVRAKLDHQISHMRTCLETAAKRGGGAVAVQERASFEGYCREEDERVVRVAIAAARALGLSGQLRSAGGGSDANVLNARGLPSIVVCTGMQKNHTHDEFCTVSDLYATARLAVEIVQQVSRMKETLTA